MFQSNTYQLKRADLSPLLLNHAIHDTKVSQLYKQNNTHTWSCYRVVVIDKYSFKTSLAKKCFNKSLSILIKHETHLACVFPYGQVLKIH